MCALAPILNTPSEHTCTIPTHNPGLLLARQAAPQADVVVCIGAPRCCDTMQHTRDSPRLVSFCYETYPYVHDMVTCVEMFVESVLLTWIMAFTEREDSVISHLFYLLIWSQNKTRETASWDKSYTHTKRQVTSPVEPFRR